MPRLTANDLSNEIDALIPPYFPPETVLSNSEVRQLLRSGLAVAHVDYATDRTVLHYRGGRYLRNWNEANTWTIIRREPTSYQQPPQPPYPYQRPPDPDPLEPWAPRTFSPPWSTDYSNKIPTKKVSEDDMFASRKDDDGAIRLCIRRGRVIKSTKVGDKYQMITFDTAKRGKDCADELNTKYFETYNQFMDRDNGLRSAGLHVPTQVQQGMVEVIAKYATFTDEPATFDPI